MDLAGRLTDSITVQSQTGSSNTGDPTFAAQRTVSARVVRKERRIVTTQGTQVQATHQVVCDQQLAITDRIWLPGADITKPAQARRVLDVGSGTELFGSETLYVADLG